MRDCGGAKSDMAPDGKATGEFMVCDGGYPRAESSSFVDALMVARKMQRFAPDNQFSIYQVSTGIHFDVLGGSFLDECPQPSITTLHLESAPSSVDGL
jgi:hypothetical protein